ncbi:MAG: hypothetical protein R3Y07_04045 [Eubacteriales bacterium]
MNLVETFKNILIVALSISALVLTSGVQESTGVSFFWQEQGESETVQTTVVQSQTTGVIPIAMMLTTTDEDTIQQFGVQYNSLAMEELFLRHATLLQEGLTQGSQAISITQAQFEKAITTPPAIYFDFLGEIPISVYAGWLTTEEEVQSNHIARRLAICAYQDGTALYYQGEGGAYLCPTPIIDLERLEKSLENTESNGTIFAFQNLDYQGLAPLTMLHAELPTAMVYEAISFATQEGEVESLAEGFGFQFAPNYQYTSSDATVIRNGNHVLRLFYDGKVTYQVEGGSNSLYAVGESHYEMVEGCRQILERIHQNSEAKIYLDTITEQGEVTTITFLYTLNGSPVVFGEEEISFTIQDHQIKGFTIPCRSYLQSTTSTSILPIVQAQIVHDSLGYEGKELILAYADRKGESVEIGWIAR